MAKKILVKFFPAEQKPECGRCSNVVLRVTDSRYVPGDEPLLGARVAEVAYSMRDCLRGWSYSFEYKTEDLNPLYADEFNACHIADVCCLSCEGEYLVARLHALEERVAELES